MQCVSGFELYYRWVPLKYERMIWTKGDFLPFYFRVRAFSRTRLSGSLEQANHYLKWTLTRANVPETAT